MARAAAEAVTRAAFADVAQGDRAQALAFMGAVSAAVYAIVACLRGAEDQHTELFHIYYQPLFVMLAMLWLWGIDVRLFEERRIAYGACFSAADQAFLLSSAQIFQACALRTRLPLAMQYQFCLAEKRGLSLALHGMR